jgi:hypothetical protein
MSYKQPSIVEADDLGEKRVALHPPMPTDEEEASKLLGHLIGEGAVEEARALVKEFAQRWPDSPRVQKWAYVLEPAKARVVPGLPAPPWDQERAWLRQHAREYPGQWVAILGDQLIAADADLSTVLEAVKHTGRERDVSLHYQPDRPWPL